MLRNTSNVALLNNRELFKMGRVGLVASFGGGLVLLAALAAHYGTRMTGAGNGAVWGSMLGFQSRGTRLLWVWLPRRFQSPPAAADARRRGCQSEFTCRAAPINARTRARMCVRVPTVHARTHARTRVHTHARTHARTYVRTHARTYARTHARMHARPPKAVS